MSITLSILTVSDTRDLEHDLSGQTIAELCQQAGWEVLTRQIVKDGLGNVQTGFFQLERLKSKVVIVNGGTGISKRDETPDAFQPILKKVLPGFGEYFRFLSIQEIGTKGLASRATAGFTNQGQLVFLLPGSPKACTLALEKIILPETPHLLFEAEK